MIDFICTSVARASFENLAKDQGFMDKDGNPAPGATFDPTPGTPEYETGIPIVPPGGGPQATGGPPEFVQGFSFNFRVSGDLEQAQIAGLPQTDAEGNLLPLRQRTKFGQMMDHVGVPWTGVNGITTGVSHAGVTFIDPESIASRQRLWQ